MMQSKQSGFVLGQRRAFATLALVIALLSFVNLAGLEKAILAIVLGIRALSPSPEPALDQRRNWARTAAILGAAHIILVATVILMNLDRLSKVIDAFRALSDLQ